MSNHPAKFNDPILNVMREMLQREQRVHVGQELQLLDPFAGTGRCHELESEMIRTQGIELEPEWAELHPRTKVGNALYLRDIGTGSIDVIATSPTYGNRMADHHVAKDDSKRLTYTHQLGRKLHPDNSGAMPWGYKYFDFHRKAWVEATRVLAPGGLFILNTKDFVRTRTIKRKRVKETVPVTTWHLNTLADLGYQVIHHERVPVKGMGYGANGNVRVAHEDVVALRRRR